MGGGRTVEWQNKTAAECLRGLGSDGKKGLSHAEAARRLKETGTNELAGPRRKGLLARFFAQLSDFMVLVLLAAAAVSFLASRIEGTGDYVDSIIILAIVVLNAVTGMIQESRAEHAMEALKKLSSPRARVIRGGREETVDAAQRVPWDLVRLRAGDIAPADLRLIESNGLSAGESALTGESLPAAKDAGVVLPEKTPLGDRKNMVFSPSEITAGNGLGVVTATGMRTEVGRIAGMIASQEPPKTPLQKRLAQTGRWLGAGALAICALIFLIGLLEHTPPLDMFLLSISLAVAAIPEGLPAVVTIVLAVGVRRMAAKKSIVRRMPAVETLGSASVICSDKTGTLTENRMTVRTVAGASGEVAAHSQEGKRILSLACLCSNCTGGAGSYRGEPTETALAAACPEEKSELERRWPRVHEIPFSSSRKRMTTVHRRPGGGYRIICKGAPDVLARYCVGSCTGFLAKNESMASSGLRVIGVAFRDTDALPTEREMEQNLTFVGLAGLSDPPRAGVKEAVAQCRAAGIRPVMITGDHAATASAIARELGILRRDGKALTGQELDALSDADLKRAVRTCDVFARVSPEHKVRIVRAFQANGEVAAMTGDGINDAPALRAADIGCAMGKSGTEVAKGAADMVLADDNFTTIVAAVREGRGVYANIRRTVHFLLSCNIGEILTVFVGFLIGLPSPLLAIQLLWVNLVTDSVPALALGVEPIEPGVMQRPPAKRGESLFSGGMGWRIAIEGCLIGAFTLAAYSVGRVFFDPDPMNPVIGRTMAFAVLSLAQIAHTFNMRGGPLFSPARRGSRLLPAALFCIFLQCSVLLVPPLAALFDAALLTPAAWGAVAAFSLAPAVLVRLQMLINRRHG